MDLIRTLSLDNHWSWLGPEILLALMGLIILATEWFVCAERAARWASALACVGFAGAALWSQADYIGLATGVAGARIGFSGLLYQCDFTGLMRLFFACIGLGVTYIAQVYFEKRQETDFAGVEFYAILLWTLAATMLLVQSHHFVLFFVALEALSVGLYVLISYARIADGALEAGLKYLILAGASSAMLLMGIALLYGAASSPLLGAYVDDAMNFAALKAFIALNAHDPLVLMGSALVLAGVAFKLGLVPFQIWIPDVYQGAPLPTTALLSVGSKPAGVCAALILIMGPFSALAAAMVPALSTLAIITILFGNLAAGPQKRIKRLIGLSGIAHAGYITMGLAAVYTVDWAPSAIIFYLFTYMLASFAVFGAMVHWASTLDQGQQLFDYELMAKKAPFLSGILAIGIGSLAGIPPLMGFIGKFFLFMAAYQAGLYSALGAAILGVVISIYYYFGWIRAATFGSWLDRNAPEEKNCACDESCAVIHCVPRTHKLLLGLIAALIVWLGLFPGALTALCF